MYGGKGWGPEYGKGGWGPMDGKGGPPDGKGWGPPPGKGWGPADGWGPMDGKGGPPDGKGWGPPPGKGWGPPDGKGWGPADGKGWGPPPQWSDPWYGGGGKDHGPAWSKGEGKKDPENEKEELVSKVKYIQRADQAGKDAWYTYCDASRTGNRDPSRHGVDSLRRFLEAHERGEAPERAAMRASSRILRLRGVPFQCNLTHVVDFLREYQVRDSDVALGYAADGRRTGEAFVEFSSTRVADEVLDAKQKQEIEGRYIEIFRSSEDERAAATKTKSASDTWSRNSPEMDKEELVARVKGVQRTSLEGREQWEKYCDIVRTGNRDPIRHSQSSLKTFLDAYERGEMPDNLPGSSSQVLRLRGVPFQSDILDVTQFLHEYGIEASNVVLGCNTEGRATGEAFAWFGSVRLAEQALEEKQKQEIRGRYIELFRSDAEEWEEASRMRSALAIADTRGPGGFPAGPGSYDAYGGGSNQWEGGQGMDEKDELVARVKSIQRSSLEGREQWEKFCDVMRTGNRDPVRHTASSIRNFLECYSKGEMPKGPTGPDSNILRLRGVPFQSDVSDVLDFLKAYRIDAEKVLMCLSATGKPTGEAIVRFPSSDFADRALNEKHKEEIRGRYIELFRSSEEEWDAASKNVYSPAVSPEDDKESLVSKVKAIQRAGGRESWERYCDALRSGAHDPGRHTEVSMRNFIEGYERGEAPELAAKKGSGDGRVLRLRGVPFQSGPTDVVRFLADYAVDASQVAMGKGADGRPTGEAFVAFNSGSDADHAMDALQKKDIRGRYIELFRSSWEDWDQAMKSGAGNTPLSSLTLEELVQRVKQIQRSDPNGKEMWYKFCDNSGTGNRDPARHSSESLCSFLEAYDRGETPAAGPLGDGRVLRLRGVPFQCSAMDVVAFLLEYSVDQSNVTINESGGKSGEAFVVFPTLDLAEHAFANKQREEISGRYIELFRSSYEERDRAMASSPSSSGRRDIVSWQGDPEPKRRREGNGEDYMGGACGSQGGMGKGYDAKGKGDAKGWEAWGPPGKDGKGKGWDSWGWGDPWSGAYGPWGGCPKGGPGPYGPMEAKGKGKMDDWSWAEPGYGKGWGAPDWSWDKGKGYGKGHEYGKDGGKGGDYGKGCEKGGAHAPWDGGSKGPGKGKGWDDWAGGDGYKGAGKGLDGGKGWDEWSGGPGCPGKGWSGMAP